MIPRTRTSVVIVHNNSVLTFFAIDPKSGKEYHFLPGGAIESGETATDAAERETLEETGFEAIVDPSSCIDKEYLFDWNGETYDVLTMFYAARLKSPFQKPKKVDDAAYNKGVVWVPVDKIKETFSYNQEICNTVLELVKLF